MHLCLEQPIPSDTLELRDLEFRFAAMFFLEASDAGVGDSFPDKENEREDNNAREDLVAHLEILRLICLW